MDAEEVLQLKVRLLTEGATLPDEQWKGRRGGAGPVGGRYFLLPNGKPCGIPIRQGETARRYNSASLEPTADPTIWIYDSDVELISVPRPKFYDMTTEDGIPYHKIALLHGNHTLATTVYQACRYWTHGTQCKFCTIPSSYISGDTILEKTPEQVVEVLNAAKDEGVVDNVLLTTGTPDTADVGLERLIRIVTAIRETSNIPIGIQFEPPVENEIIHDIAVAGANAVGIHIESADESVREEMCPGKFQYGPLDTYRKSWQFALNHFDRGNVSTFLLYGLGENLDRTLSLVRELAQIGILPVVTPIRPSQGSQLANFLPSYVNNLEGSIVFYKQVGRTLYKNNLNPDNTVAGCHKCGGCTPNQEAFDWAAQAENQ
jgi:radical SAM protein (TIGR04043 family)